MAWLNVRSRELETGGRIVRASMRGFAALIDEVVAPQRPAGTATRESLCSADGTHVLSRPWPVVPCLEPPIDATHWGPGHGSMRFGAPQWSRRITGAAQTGLNALSSAHVTAPQAGVAIVTLVPSGLNVCGTMANSAYEGYNGAAKWLAGACRDGANTHYIDAGRPCTCDRSSASPAK